MTVLFVVPCGDYYPSGIVRLRRMSFGGRAVRSSLLGLASAADFMHKWGTRARILWLAPCVDLVFLQGVLPPVWYMRALMRLNPYTVLDLDDGIFLDSSARGKSVMAQVWRVIAGSHFIFDYASPLNSHVALVPSSVSLAAPGTRAYMPSKSNRTSSDWAAAR